MKEGRVIKSTHSRKAPCVILGVVVGDFSSGRSPMRDSDDPYA
jgi:hypothetical protein